MKTRLPKIFTDFHLLNARELGADHVHYKPRTDLNLNKANQPESALIEIINSRKRNIVGCPYKHSNMDILDKLSKENKQVFHFGDCNISLLKYSDHQPTNQFLDSLSSTSFIPYVLQPTRITSRSKTLIDDIFSNIISPEVVSGNVTATISDHMSQFLFTPNVLSKSSSQKSNTYQSSLFKQTLHLTILVKIGLMFSN